MSQEFSEAFEQLFTDNGLKLERLLKIKLKALRHSSNPDNLLDSYEDLIKYRIDKISRTYAEMDRNLVNFERIESKR